MQQGLIQDRTIVVNVKTEAYDVYIGRPSIWGNPFKLPRDGSRDECIEKYRKWILHQPHLLSRVHELRGKRLGCFCAPLKCHGDVLAALADGDYVAEDKKST